MRGRRRVEHAECADHREMIMEHLGPGWVWRLHCGRVYRREKVRWDSENGIYMCAYEDCDGDALLDAWDYEERRGGMPMAGSPRKRDYLSALHVKERRY